MLIGVPPASTPVERRAVKESAKRMKVGDVRLVEEPMAAAIGAGLPVTEPTGNMIVDIGGGTTDIAVVSLAGLVYGRSLRVAGGDLDEAIIQYFKRKYNLLIGEPTAERVKCEIGSAKPLEHPLETEVKGRHLSEGVLRTVRVKDDEIREALSGADPHHRQDSPGSAGVHSTGAERRHLRARHRAHGGRRACCASSIDTCTTRRSPSWSPDRPLDDRVRVVGAGMLLNDPNLLMKVAVN
jgi:hypothetical protein